uniref:Uncharacterized protein n=1 Tax=Oryza rufipogon TaxID=4529 RepID=A0A0E0NW37_ORYRU
MAHSAASPRCHLGVLHPLCGLLSDSVRHPPTEQPTTRPHSSGTDINVPLHSGCNFVVTIAGSQYKFQFDSKFVGLIKPGSICVVNGAKINLQVRYTLEVIVQVDLTLVGTNSISFPSMISPAAPSAAEALIDPSD